MPEQIILHHYDNSPYAEKIRLMFGLTNTSWQSLLSPIKPPRPNVDPLTGGYRRIPVAQIGADIFCDTSLISEEVARITGNKELDPSHIDGDAADLMKRAEQEVFFAAITAIPPLRLLTTMFLRLGPLEVIPFIKDRKGMLKGGTHRQTNTQQSQRILATLIEDMETQLADQPWLAGDKATVADFSVYHPLWLHANFNRKPLEAGPNVTQWFKAVAKIGHGHREEVSQAYAFQIAKVANPRDLPDSVDSSPLPVGSQVNVAPEDYAIVPVGGTLAAVTNDRIILARDTEQFGKLHVHFPRKGYSISE